MRGSTLIFHSLDPETLERVSDLDSLDPESDGDDERDRYSRYSELDSDSRLQLQSNTSSSSSSSSHDTDTLVGTTNTNANYNSNSRNQSTQSNYFPHESSSSSSRTRTRTNPIGLGLGLPRTHSSPENLGESQNTSPEATKKNRIPIPTKPRSLISFSGSPPLTKSHYYVHDNEADSDERSRSQQINEINKTSTLLTVGPQSRMPLSRIRQNHYNDGQNYKVNSTSGSHHFQLQFQPEENRRNNGFSRLFNFRKDKQDKSRIDIYNLSPNLRAELKQIYVY